MKELPQLSRLVSVSQLAAFIVGMLYVSGYYINSIFLRNLGIPDTELFRLEYIKVGFVFWLITLAFVFLPAGCFLLTYKVRKESGLPHYHIGAIGNSLNATLFLAYPLFLAFFATKYEWTLSLHTAIGPLMTIQQAVICFVALSSLGVIIVPFIERIVNLKSKAGLRLWVFRIFIEPLRYGILIICAYIIYASTSQISWVPLLASRGLYYFMAGFVFVVGMSAAVLWVRHIQYVRGGGLVYALITFGLAILYYMAITSYVFGVLTFIPCNRGGRLPMTEAYLELRDHPTLFPAYTNRTDGTFLYGPAYIIEENGDSLFLASDGMDHWLTDFVPIHVLRKELAPYVYLRRITDGYPRTKRPYVEHNDELSGQLK